MPMVDIRHVLVLMLDLGMFVCMGMSHIRCIVHVKLIVAMSVFMQDGHMDMKMSVLLICEQQYTCCHQSRGEDKQ